MGGPGTGKRFTGTALKGLFPAGEVDVYETSALLDSYRGSAGEEVRRVKAAGRLVSPELVVPVVIGAIKESEARFVLLDGSPRTRPQAELLYESIAAMPWLICSQFVLEADPDQALANLRQRAAEQPGTRTDEHPEVQSGRYQRFLEESVPAIKHFEALGVPTFRRLAGRDPLGQLNAEAIRDWMLSVSAAPMFR